jgi:hypothetical protein
MLDTPAAVKTALNISSYYAFTPDTDGLYTFTCSGAAAAASADGQGAVQRRQLWQQLRRSKEITAYLRADDTYYLVFSAYDTAEYTLLAKKTVTGKLSGKPTSLRQTGRNIIASPPPNPPSTLFLFRKNSLEPGQYMTAGIIDRNASMLMFEAQAKVFKIDRLPQRGYRIFSLLITERDGGGSIAVTEAEALATDVEKPFYAGAFID